MNKHRNKYIDWKYKKFGNPIEIILENFPESTNIFFFSMSNDLTIPILRRFITVKWDWGFLSRDAFSSKEILNNLDLPWKWDWYSSNKTLCLSFVKNNLHLNWNWQKISENPAIKAKDIIENPDLPWVFRLRIGIRVYGGLSFNPNITLGLIHKYFEKDWIRSSVSVYVNLNDSEMSLETFNTLHPEYLDFSSLSRNQTLNIDLVLKLINENWDWFSISENSNITTTDIENNLTLPWKWKKISRNINLTEEFVDKYHKKGWNWESICRIRNLSLKFIYKYKEKFKRYGWLCLSSNPNFATIENVQSEEFKFFQDKICWFSFSENIRLTCDVLELFQDKPWDLEGLARNKTISLELIEKHKEKFELEELWETHFSTNIVLIYDILCKKNKKYMSKLDWTFATGFLTDDNTELFSINISKDIKTNREKVCLNLNFSKNLNQIVCLYVGYK